MRTAKLVEGEDGKGVILEEDERMEISIVSFLPQNPKWLRRNEAFFVWVGQDGGLWNYRFWARNDVVELPLAGLHCS